jgi:aldehyde:ferredoxin oxidoreductase
MPNPCWRCSIACNYKYEVQHGRENRLAAYNCGGAENIEGVGSDLGIVEPGQNMLLLDMCDAYGMKCGHVGCAIGAAVEAFRKRLLKEKDTDKQTL